MVEVKATKIKREVVEHFKIIIMGFKVLIIIN